MDNWIIGLVGLWEFVARRSRARVGAPLFAEGMGLDGDGVTSVRQNPRTTFANYPIIVFPDVESLEARPNLLTREVRMVTATAGRLAIDQGDAHQFLELIHPSPRQGLVEFRFLSSTGLPARTTFVGPGDEWPWSSIQSAQDEGRHVYVAVAQRARPDGHKSAVSAVTALWADIDAKQHGGDKRATAAALESLPEEFWPSVVIDSGNGHHGYWLLDEPVTFGIDGQDHEDDPGAQMQYVEGANKGIAKAVGGDGVGDLSRVMRVPGTWNLKDPESPLRCHVISTKPDRRFPIGAFERYLIATAPGGGRRDRGALPPVNSAEGPLFDLLDAAGKDLARGKIDGVKGGRSMALWLIGVQLAARGADAGSIAAYLKAVDQVEFHKYDERSNDGEYWRIAEKVSNSAAQQQIERTRTEGKPGRSRQRATTDAIRKDMQRNGRFLNDGNTAVYFCDGVLFEINAKNDDLAALLWKRDRSNQSTVEYKFLIDELKPHARIHGERVQRRQFCHYDEARNTLFLSNNRGSMYRIREDEISILDNGTDGILFSSEELPLLKIGEAPSSGVEPSLLDECVLGVACLEGSEAER